MRGIEESPFVVTVEEGVLAGGFGSAVLEAASDAGLDTHGIRRLGIPDRFIEHGERAELLADLGLDAPASSQRAAARPAEWRPWLTMIVTRWHENQGAGRSVNSVVRVRESHTAAACNMTNHERK